MDMNQYMKDRWQKRREKAIEYLGGKCVVCGTTTALEFDHIDPKTKIITIARASSFSEERFWEEVNKCQLLCYTHHKQKTNTEQTVDHGEGLTGKRNCRCELCGPLKNKWQQQNRKSRARS